jgi:hypothetical protein
MPFNGLVSRLGEGSTAGSVMHQLQQEFNEIFMRLDKIEKRLMQLHPANADAELLETFYGKSYTSEQVKSPDQQRLSIEQFKQAFGQKVADDLTLCQPIPYVPGNPEQKKEEVHPAHSSSFVLKI